MAVQPPSSRNKILDVAEVRFSRRGFAGVGMRELAECAGLSKSSLFHHFRSKHQLYFEVLGRVLARVQQRLAPVMALDTDPATRLDRLIDAAADALAEHPPAARLLLRGLFEEDDVPEEPLPEAEACERVLAEILEDMQRVLRDGVDQGVFRPVSVPHTVQTLIGAIVYHFASGELGEGLLGRPLLSAEAVDRHKRELRQIMHLGLVAQPEATA